MLQACLILWLLRGALVTATVAMVVASRRVLDGRAGETGPSRHVKAGLESVQLRATRDFLGEFV